MTMYGANPEQLAHLGRTLRTQIEQVRSVRSTVDGVLSGTTWQGPARDRFGQEWTDSFTLALRRLEDAFEAAGRDCLTRADELQRIMGT
jgi:uncharacterized protein YukE